MIFLPLAFRILGWIRSDDLKKVLRDTNTMRRGPKVGSFLLPDIHLWSDTRSLGAFDHSKLDQRIKTEKRRWQIYLVLSTAFFLATFRILTGFGNAGNWVFLLEFYQDPWVFSKFVEFIGKILNFNGKFGGWISVLPISSQFIEIFCQILPKNWFLGLSLSFFPWVFEFLSFFTLSFFWPEAKKKAALKVG